MSKQEDSNVIQVDFNTKKTIDESTGIRSFTNLIDKIVKGTEDPDEWPEDLTPKERCDQLKKDLEFLRKMNNTPTK